MMMGKEKELGISEYISVDATDAVSAGRVSKTRLFQTALQRQAERAEIHTERDIVTS